MPGVPVMMLYHRHRDHARCSVLLVRRGLMEWVGPGSLGHRFRPQAPASELLIWPILDAMSPCGSRVRLSGIGGR